MMMMTNLYNSPILKEGHGSNTLVCPTYYVHRSPDLSPIMLPLANIGKDSSPMNPLHAHVARPHSITNGHLLFVIGALIL